MGRASFKGLWGCAQVSGLLPGRRYALRVTVRPKLLPVYRDMAPLPPSAPAVIETQPAPPGPPPAARLVGRARNFLKARFYLCDLISSRCAPLDRVWARPCVDPQHACLL